MSSNEDFLNAWRYLMATSSAQPLPHGAEAEEKRKREVDNPD
jgi:hypothetical protein